MIVKKLMLLVASAFFITAALAQQDQALISDIQKHRKEQRREFKNKATSPLPKEAIKKFKGLNYFPIDLTYRVPIRFEKNEQPIFL